MNDEVKNFDSTILAAQSKNDARLEMLYDIGSILASSETIDAAALRILEAVCRALQYDAGEFWSFEREGKNLHLKTAWHSTAEAEVFLEESRKFEFSKNVGLPGQVWGAAAPVWIENLSEALNFPRKDAALRTGFHSAFAFPVLPGEKVSGVFNFFSREIREPDEDLLNIFAAVGNLIGQFIKRENAEERFRESEARYRIVAETASDGLISINEDSEILFANPATERIFGHKVEKVIGQKLTMLMPEYLRAVHEAGVARYVETGKRHLNWEHIEVSGLHADGYEFPLELSFGESNQNGKRVFIGIARDITERKKAEQNLLERERLALLNSDVSFALIQNNSLQDILRACTEAVVKHLDAAFARIWTLNKQNNILELQTSSGIYTHLDGEHSRIPVGKYKIGLIAAERKPHLTNSVISDARVSEHEWAKRERMVAFAGYPLVVEKHLVGVIAMFARQPLTSQTIEALASISNTIALGIERKQTEAEREKLLENEKELRFEAEIANRSKDEFIAVVSHELRSPLNAMLGWTRILQNTATDTQTTAHALDVIVRNARSQSKLIEDLLDSSRISRGELRLDMQPLELVPIIKSAIELTIPVAQAKEISISERLETTANFITGDADRINQILDNLLSNAIKFTPPGGSVEFGLKGKK
jgi:PAS domain S-box-containing protein